MRNLLFLLCALVSIQLSAQQFELIGKYKKSKIDGKEAFSSKSISIKVKDQTLLKSENLRIEFNYQDSGKGFFYVDYLTSDTLYKPLEGDWVKSADAVKLTGSGQWKPYSVILKKTDFQPDSKYHIILAGRGANVSVSDVKISPVTNEAKTSKKSEKMNVLMIIVDDLNDYVKSFGDPQAITPNVDRLVSQSMRFTRTFCQYPVCGPSRASFLSGLYPESSKILNNTDYLREENPGAVNIFEHFKKNGYWTAGAGKIFHSKFGMYEKGTSFDEYEKFSNAEDPQKLLLKHKFELAGEKGSFNDYVRKNRVNDQGELVLCYGTELEDDQHGDGRSARRVAEWLVNNESGEKPFLIACGLVKPHVPFYAPKKYFDLFPQDKLQFDDVPVNDWKDKPKLAAVKGYKRFRSEMGVNDRKVRAEYLQAYLSCISFMDAQVKVLMDALKKSGKADNTVVVFMSDHGFHIGEHFMYGKVTLFEECTRVPFSIHVPGSGNNGKSSESLAELVDVYPTLVDLCNLPQPKHSLQGKSLAPVLKDPSTKVREASYSVVSRGNILGRSVRDDQWRYAEWGSPEQSELYNLKNDPLQYKNLAGDKQYTKVLQRMRKILQGKMAIAK